MDLAKPIHWEEMLLPFSHQLYVMPLSALCYLHLKLENLCIAEVLPITQYQSSVGSQLRAVHPQQSSRSPSSLSPQP